MFVLLKIIINSCKKQTKKCCYKLFNYWEEFLWWVGWGLKQYKVLYSDQSYRLQWVDNFNPLLISIKQLLILIIITTYTMVWSSRTHTIIYLSCGTSHSVILRFFNREREQSLDLVYNSVCSKSGHLWITAATTTSTAAAADVLIQGQQIDIVS